MRDLRQGYNPSTDPGDSRPLDMSNLPSESDTGIMKVPRPEVNRRASQSFVEFLWVLRQALLMIVRWIEKKYGIENN